MDPPRWKIITPSQYEWERRALDFIRAGLPNHDPYRAWANFEFQSHDGAIYEVDLLVLTKQGFWLVEIKSWPGKVSGDAGTWTRTHEGKTISEDNPVLLANRKAKALSSLLKCPAGCQEGPCAVAGRFGLPVGGRPSMRSERPCCQSCAAQGSACAGVSARAKGNSCCSDESRRAGRRSRLPQPDR